MSIYAKYLEKETMWKKCIHQDLNLVSSVHQSAPLSLHQTYYSIYMNFLEV